MLPNDHSALLPKVTIDRWPVNITNLTELKRRIFAELTGGSSSFLVCTLNLDHLVKLRRDVDFQDAYSRAKFVTADGFPIVTLASLSGWNIELTTGSDSIEPICKMAEENDLPIFLVGSTLAVLCTSASTLFAKYPGLDIRGVFSPPRGFDPKSQFADEVIEIISLSGARICFVALGAPCQEIFSSRAVGKTSSICFLPIGAGLDFIAGSQARAPKVLQKLKLEWAWRLILNPIRHLVRYSRCAILFFELIVRHCCLQRESTRS